MTQDRISGARPIVDMIGAQALLVLAFGGYVKGSRFMAWLPFDLTLFAGLVVTLLVVASVSRAPGLPRHPVVLWFLLAACGCGLLAAGAEANSYAEEKIGHVFLMAPLCIVGGLYLLRTVIARAAFAVGVVALGFAVLVLARLDPASMQAGGRLASEGSSTIGTGRAVGAAALVLIIFAISARRRLPWLLVSVVAVVGTVGVASRGPLIAAAIGVAVPLVLARRRGRLLRALILATSTVVLIQVTLAEGAVNRRLTTLDDTSASARRTLWSHSLDLIAASPLGIGWGRLYERVGSIANSDGWVQYSHNVLLEVTLEAGWIAGLALIATLAAAFRRQLVLARGGLTEMVMLGLLVYALTNSLVSGDVNSNRGLWVAFGAALAVAPPVRRRRAAVDSNSARMGYPPRIEGGPHGRAIPSLSSTRPG